MADRTHDEERALTGRTPASDPDARPRPESGGAYQEGRVESISQRPTGRDEDDRSGDGQGGGMTRGREEGRDNFISSEVAERTSHPMRDPKTRS